MARTTVSFTTVIEITGQSLLGVFLAGDACRHCFFAVGAKNHTSKEISFYVLTSVVASGKLNELAVAGESVHLHKVFNRNSRFEVILFCEINAATPLAMDNDSCIDRVANNHFHFLNCPCEFHMRAVGLPARVVVSIKVLSDLFQRFAIHAHLECSLDKIEVLAVWPQELPCVFAVTMLCAADVLAFLRAHTISTAHVVAELVGVLLRENKSDAKKHFPACYIFETEAHKFEIFDDPFVE